MNKIKKKSINDNIYGLLFTLPFVIIYTALMIYPSLKGVYISFFHWDLMSTEISYAGSENFNEMFLDDDLFLISIKNTLIFSFLTVPLMILIAFIIALNLNKEGKYISFLRGVFFSTSVLSIAIAALIWQLLFEAGDGFITKTLSNLGFGDVLFFSDPHLAMPSLIAVTVWWGIGFPMLIFVAGLQQIPQDTIDAAKMDGANKYQRIFYIICPQIKHIFFLNFILQIIAQLQLFGQPALLTGGGPDDKTTSLVQYIYMSGWGDWRLGYSSAMSIILFFIILIPITIQFILQRTKK